VFTIRRAGETDVAKVMDILDRAAAWLVSIGRTGQWGTARQSDNPRRWEQARSWLVDGELFLAELDGRPVGALAVAPMPQWDAPPAGEPELYVRFLLSDPDLRGHAVGGRLLDHARAVAAANRIGLLRVDCYGGDDRKLVAYYERHGFTALGLYDTVLPNGASWPRQLLEQRLDRAPGAPV